VLDDLHALEGAPLALAELTHTLDALAEEGASVVVAARTRPGHWRGWPRRLISRLMGGLAVQVEPPGLSSRRRYLLERARAGGVPLANEAVDALAEAADGYRTLDGWLVRLALSARVERRTLDRALVAAFLADDGEAGLPLPSITIDQVARAVAARFGVSIRELCSPSRRHVVAEARHLAMHLARNSTGLSFAAIGTHFGGRDAATVRHACRATSTRLAADPAFAATANDLSRRWLRPKADG
jgi:chromosomal replication initiator protein